MADAKQAEEAQTIIQGEIEDVFALERTLQATEEELMTNETFRKFLELQKTVQEQSAKVWKAVEAQMIAHDIKSIKGDWGSITIAQRQNFKIDIEQLPSKFIKKVPDTTRIAASYKLEGKPPKGCEPYTTQYLTKRIK